MRASQHFEDRRVLARNPVTGVKVPKGSDEVDEMHPYTENELEAAHLVWPEGSPVKATKGRSMRRVPLWNRVLPIVRELAHGKAPHDLLFTTSGGAQPWRSSSLRLLDWTRLDEAGNNVGTGRGRRLHDLRHTAACLWLARRIDPGTVQAWCGHESIATTNRYLHYLGPEPTRRAWIA